MRCGRALVALGGMALALVLVLAPGAGPVAAQSGGGEVRFGESSLQAMESYGQVRVVVERVDLPVSRMVVRYRTAEVSGSAVSGADFQQTTGSLVFDVGVRSNVFTVWVRDDAVAEETEHLLLHLETSSGTGATSRLTILDDDLEPAAAAAAGGGGSGGSAAGGGSGATASGGGSSLASSTAPSVPVVVAAPARVTRRVVVTQPRVRARPAAPRRIILQQTPTTPFELRPLPGSDVDATRVDPLLALGAGLLLARVAAEVWFRARLALA